MTRFTKDDIKRLYEKGKVSERDKEFVETHIGVKKSKYRNVKTVVNGISFDSRKEAAWYAKYDLLQRAGILTFEMQVKYDLIVNGIKIGFYKADFVLKYPDGKIEVVDIKGVKTSTYALKKRMIKAIYGIEIIEK